MRIAALLSCLFTIAFPLAAQEGEPGSKPIRRGDTIAVTGCLNGGALDATDISARDAASSIAAGVTFRLKGEKTLLRQLREEHDRKVVEVRGVLRSNLPRADRQTRTVGNLRIGIGTPSPGAGRPEAEPGRALPILEVKSFSGTTRTSCAS